jgi:uridine kinase
MSQIVTAVTTAIREAGLGQGSQAPSEKAQLDRIREELRLEHSRELSENRAAMDRMRDELRSEREARSRGPISDDRASVDRLLDELRHERESRSRDHHSLDDRVALDRMQEELRRERDARAKETYEARVAADERTRRLEEDLRRIEERAKSSEDRARRTEDFVRLHEEKQKDLLTTAEGTRRRQQDEVEHVRKVADQQETLHLEVNKTRHQTDAMNAELVRLRAEADANRAKLASEMARTETDMARRFQLEQNEDRAALDRVREELRLERESRVKDLQREQEQRRHDMSVEVEARRLLESTNAAQTEVLRAAQKAAEDAKRAVQELSRQKDAELGSLTEAVNAAAEENATRVKDLETQMKMCYVDALRKMSMPDRIMYYQTLHSQSVGSKLGGFNGGQRALEYGQSVFCPELTPPRPSISYFPQRSAAQFSSSLLPYQRENVVIGITGCSRSCKAWVAKELLRRIAVSGKKTTIIGQDDFWIQKCQVNVRGHIRSSDLEAECTDHEKLTAAIKEKTNTYDVVIVEGVQLVHHPGVTGLLNHVFLLELDKGEARRRRTQPRDATLNPNPLQPCDFDDLLWPAHERYMKDKVSPLGARVIRLPSPATAAQRDEVAHQIMRAAGFATQERTCNLGHVLQKYVVPSFKQSCCNSCGRRQILSPEEVYRCEACDFDLCAQCYDGQGQMKADWKPLMRRIH